MFSEGNVSENGATTWLSMVDFNKTAANQAGVFGIIKTSNPATFQAGFQALKSK